MSALRFRVRSNVAMHGHLFAVQHEINRLRRRGCSERRAFALAAAFVFGRYVR